LPDKPFYTDKDLFLLISEGDQDAFKDLFNKYVKTLYPYITEVLKSSNGAEDIIQDSFIRIWLNREKLESIQNPASWIFKIVLHECYNVLRRKLTESKVLGMIQKEYYSPEQYVEQDIQYSQTKTYLAEAVELLTPQRRKIYELSRINGLKVSQIAIELDLSVSKVKNTLSAALTSIRDHLASKGIIYAFLAGLYFFA
jgi:RNA polymerase sigma-70 factor (family 1)